MRILIGTNERSHPVRDEHFIPRKSTYPLETLPSAITPNMWLTFSDNGNKTVFLYETKIKSKETLLKRFYVTSSELNESIFAAKRAVQIYFDTRCNSIVKKQGTKPRFLSFNSKTRFCDLLRKSRFLS